MLGHERLGNGVTTIVVMNDWMSDIAIIERFAGGEAARQSR
jgi:hypothetical protein